MVHLNQEPRHVLTLRDDTFWSLVKPQAGKKKRACLKCSITFMSMYSNRLCSQCDIKNRLQSDKAVYPDPI